jgi:Na+/alanine symporter
VYLNIIWSLGNIGNAIMAVPNLIGLLILAGTVAAVSRERL